MAQLPSVVMRQPSRRLLSVGGPDLIRSHVMLWPQSPFSFANESQLSSEVVSIRLFDQHGEQLVIHNLEEPIEVTIRTYSVDNHTADFGTLACVNAYDIAQNVTGACDALLNLGYICEQDFCHDCPLATFCRKACQTTIRCTDDQNITCALQQSYHCSYFDVEAGAWTLGEKCEAGSAPRGVNHHYRYFVATA